MQLIMTMNTLNLTESGTTREIPFDCPNYKKTFYTQYHYARHECDNGSKLKIHHSTRTL
jgi:hypothetical protein